MKRSPTFNCARLQQNIAGFSKKFWKKNRGKVMSNNDQKPCDTLTQEQKELAPLIEKMLDFYKKRDWEKFHSPKNLAMVIASEVGELIDHFRWLTEDQSYHLEPK